MARSSRSRTAAAAALVIACTAATLSGHRRDEYLQAARVAIEPDRVRVELDLTPGIAVAESVLGDIDRDADGSISPAEEKAYVARVVAALSLEIDGRPLVPRVTRTAFSAPAAMRAGEGTLRIELGAPLSGVSPGPHRLTFRNGHRPDVSVYLANALVPASDRVSVTNQGRDYAQRALDIDYVLRDGARSVGWPAGIGAAAMLTLLWFVVQQKGTP